MTDEVEQFSQRMANVCHHRVICQKPGAAPEAELVGQVVEEALPGQPALHLHGTSARHDE